MKQVILISGASKGIGLEIAQTLQQAGHTVYGTSRNPSTVQNNGIKLLPLDVTDALSVQKCVEQVIQQTGRIDVLINNAGYDLYGAAEDTSFEELMAQMDANFLGAVRLTQAVLPFMRQQESGKIINMSSIGGLLSLPFNSAYSASKFALEGYSESLRYELLPFNIYVSMIEPGQVRTNTLEESIRSTRALTRFGNAERIAERAREAGRKANLTPQQVAKGVARVVAVDHPQFRYLIGGQARLISTLHTLLPASLFETFILRQFVHPVLAKL